MSILKKLDLCFIIILIPGIVIGSLDTYPVPATYLGRQLIKFFCVTGPGRTSVLQLDDGSFYWEVGNLPWPLTSVQKAFCPVIASHHHHTGYMHSYEDQSAPLCQMAVDPTRRFIGHFDRFCFFNPGVSNYTPHQKCLVQEPVQSLTT